jgi:hypothetical protein
MAGTDGEDENGDGGWKCLLQDGIVIVIRYERQQESKVPWHMRFTPSWQFTLTDRLDHQRRRMRRVYTTTIARTDGPGSEDYMGKGIALTSDDLMACSITAQLVTGTIESREPDDGRNGGDWGKTALYDVWDSSTHPDAYETAWRKVPLQLRLQDCVAAIQRTWQESRSRGCCDA